MRSWGSKACLEGKGKGDVNAEERRGVEVDKMWGRRCGGGDVRGRVHDGAEREMEEREVSNR
jgi:hypothetical protein